MPGERLYIRKILSFLRAHPVLCLLLLTPGIPEYLSSSSALNAIILNPFLFLFQVVANLGLYVPGALLVREAMVRWKKGWASVLLLGAAYGIMEEGIALSTLFNPTAGPVGQLGYYGHWLGVSWVWTAGILAVHMLYSISVPILLLGLALPETRGKDLLSSRGVAAAFAMLGLDVFFLILVIARLENFWMGWPLFLGSFGIIGALIYAAHKTPADLLKARTQLPQKGPRVMAFLGALFYTGVLFTEFLGIGAKLPAAAVFGLVVGVQGLFLLLVLSWMGSQGNEHQLLGFTFGLILPIAVFGILAEVTLPFTLVADIPMVLFFRKLWRNYDIRPGSYPQVQERHS